MWIQLLIYTVLRIYPDLTQASGLGGKAGDLIPCERGWLYFKNKCYGVGGKGITERLTQEQAAAQCVSQGGKLVTIQSKELQEFLVTFLLLEAKTNLWIGLNDRAKESVFVWEDGSIANCTNWESSDPDGPNAESEDCVEMIFLSLNDDVKTGEWNNIPCSQRRGYICETEKTEKISADPRFCSSTQGVGWKYNSSCYHVITDNKYWWEAEQHCQDHFKGHLVKILDFTVDIFLDYVLSNFNIEPWIGNGKQSREKNNVEAQCYLKTTVPMLWAPVFCDSKHPFICQSSKTAETSPTETENWKMIDYPIFIGIAVCILLVGILIGVGIYCFLQRRRNSSGIQMQPSVSSSHQPVVCYTSADVFIKEDDNVYERMT